uniref:Uncharacterized protein n=1 Tax=Brassica campestris TaxID=3711 RepID=A0A3P6CX92_BRACM|nr:unnamed protein product [Brassica rapa]
MISQFLDHTGLWIAVCSVKSSHYMVKSWLETKPRKIKTFQRFSRRLKEKDTYFHGEQFISCTTQCTYMW